MPDSRIQPHQLPPPQLYPARLGFDAHAALADVHDLAQGVGMIDKLQRGFHHIGPVVPGIDHGNTFLFPIAWIKEGFHKINGSLSPHSGAGRRNS